MLYAKVVNLNNGRKYDKERANEYLKIGEIYEVYNIDMVKNIVLMFDTRCFHYRNLITFKQFQQDIELLKPRK